MDRTIPTASNQQTDCILPLASGEYFSITLRCKAARSYIFDADKLSCAVQVLTGPSFPANAKRRKLLHSSSRIPTRHLIPGSAHA